MKIIKNFFRVYTVDVVLFGVLFLLGFLVKSSLGDFFLQVENYQTEIQALEAGLANQSTEALLSLDPLVGDFHSLVLKAFLLTLVVVPLVSYVLLTFVQYLQVQKTFSFRKYGRAFLLGLPLLLFFFLAMSSFFEAFGNLLYSQSALFLFLLYLVGFSLLGYIWYILVSLEKFSWRIIYTRFFPLYFVFLLFFLVYLFLLLFLVYILVAFMTGSFLGNALWISLVSFFFLIGILELCRLLFAFLLRKYTS